jgi:hypothetical protein
VSTRSVEGTNQPYSAWSLGFDPGPDPLDRDLGGKNRKVNARALDLLTLRKELLQLRRTAEALSDEQLPSPRKPSRRTRRNRPSFFERPKG